MTPDRARLRLFAALELPPAAVAALEAFRDRAADPAVWRPLPAASLHVTLAFLGATDAGRVGELTAALEAAAGPAPLLELGGALLLPPRRARVLCATLADGQGRLAALQARVSEELAATGAYAPEARPFRAHVTVARLRHGARCGAVGRRVSARFEVQEVVLARSVTHPGGARYETLGRWPARRR